MTNAQTFLERLKTLEKDGQKLAREIMQQCIDTETGAAHSALAAHLHAMDMLVKARVETQSTVYRLSTVSEELKLVTRTEHMLKMGEEG